MSPLDYCLFYVVLQHPMHFVSFFVIAGFFNFVVFFRPRYMRNKQKHPEWTVFKAIRNKDNEDERLGAWKMRSTIKMGSKKDQGVITRPPSEMVAEA